MKEYTVELPDERKETCKLEFFMLSLDFVKENDAFSTAEMQRYLKCGYGTVSKVLDVLCTLCVIEKISGPPSLKYKSLLKGE